MCSNLHTGMPKTPNKTVNTCKLNLQANFTSGFDLKTCKHWGGSRREDKEVLKYLGQSNKRCGQGRTALLSPQAGSERRSCESGMWLSWMLARGCYSHERLFFWKQSENFMPPGRDYSSLFQCRPHYLNNLFCDIILPLGQVFSSCLFAFTVYCFNKTQKT